MERNEVETRIWGHLFGISCMEGSVLTNCVSHIWLSLFTFPPHNLLSGNSTLGLNFWKIQDIFSREVWLFSKQQRCCLRKGYISLNRWAASVKRHPQAHPCPLQTCFLLFPDCPLFQVHQNTLVIWDSRFPLDLWLSQLQNLPHGPILMCAKSCMWIWPVSAPSNSRRICPHHMALSWEPLLFSKGPQTFMMWWRGVQTIWKAPMMVR